MIHKSRKWQFWFASFFWLSSINALVGFLLPTFSFFFALLVFLGDKFWLTSILLFVGTYLPKGIILHQTHRLTLKKVFLIMTFPMLEFLIISYLISSQIIFSFIIKFYTNIYHRIICCHPTQDVRSLIPTQTYILWICFSQIVWQQNIDIF